MFVRQFENPATLPPHGKREDFATSVLHQFQHGINWCGALRKWRDFTMSTSLSMSHMFGTILPNTHPLSNIICLNHSMCAMPLYPIVSPNCLDVLCWWPTLLKHMVVQTFHIFQGTAYLLPGSWQIPSPATNFPQATVNSIRVFFWPNLG